VLASAPPTLASRPPSATFSTQAENSCYASGLQLNFRERFLTGLY